MDISLLIVDDEDDITEMLSRHFRFQGYKVVTACDGQQALNVLARQRIDIVISDIKMPVMNGVQLCERLRKDYPLSRIIMMTGHETLENVLACRRKGAYTCIFKPLEDLGELDEAVRQLVDNTQKWMAILKKLRS